MSQQQAIKRVRELTAQARRDWFAVHGRPMPEVDATDRRKELNEFATASILTKVRKAGCSARDADMHVIKFILLRASLIDSGVMDASGEMVQ
jgi:hypothetical protein